jgi:hypothetical protein
MAAIGSGDSHTPYFAVGALCSGLPTVLLTAALIMKRVSPAADSNL